MKNANMWVIEMESGERFTLTADGKGEAIRKALQWRRGERVHKVTNVAEMIAAAKIY